MFELGRVVVKTAGRDAGLKGVVIDVIDRTFVVVEGELRRRKCNVRHLEPMQVSLKISRNAPHEEIVAELKKAGILISSKVVGEKPEPAARPRKQRAKSPESAEKEKKA